MKHRIVIVLPLMLAASSFSGRIRADEGDKVKARQHFRQGVEYFDQKRFGDALTEFEESYRLIPVYSTLFNVGQVRVALGHPVQAVDAYEKFLVSGGASISPRQRAIVEAELKTQRERIGDVKVIAEPEGSEVRIDGESVGKSPLTAAVRVAAGHHRLEAMLDGYRSEQSVVDVPGRGHVEVAFKLHALTPVAAPASPAVRLPADSTTSPAQPAPQRVPQSAVNRRDLSPHEFVAGSTSSGRVQRIVGYSLAGVGLITAGVGVGFGVDGQSKHNDALSQWVAGDHAAARQTESESSEEKTKGYVVMGVGGAVLATGAIVLLTAPSGDSSQVRLSWSLSVGSSVTGAAVEGTW